MTLRSLADLYIYPNRIAALRLTGAQVADWLERAASCYNQLKAGVQDELLINPAHPSYNFEIIYNVTCAFDLTGPARFEPDGSLIDPAHCRVRDLRFNGQPIDPDADFIVCTNSFRAHGAGNFPGAGPQAVVFEHTAITRDILRDHVAGQGVLQVDAAAPFRLQAPGQTHAILRTAPIAFDHIAQIAPYAPQVAGVDKKGFLRLRVTLPVADADVV